MDKYLELLLDLLEIQEKEKYLNLGREIALADADETFCFAHRGAFILEAYLQLLQGELAPEEFILLGDVESLIPLWKEGQITAEMLITGLKKGELPWATTIILDESVWLIMTTEEERKQLTQILTEHKRKLLLN